MNLLPFAFALALLTPSVGQTPPIDEREEARARLAADLLPLPMPPETLVERLASRFDEPDVRTAAEAAIARYLEQTERDEDRLRRPLAARLDAAYAWQPGLRRYEPRPGPEQVSFLEGRVEWNLALDRAEESLFESVGQLQAEPGSPSLEAVRLELVRRRDERPAQDPAVSLRLDEILASVPVIPEQRAAVERELARWRSRLLPAMRARRQAVDSIEIARARTIANAGAFPEVVADAAERAATDRALAGLDASAARVEVPISKLTHETIDTIRDWLAPPAARPFEEKTGRVVHPELYEDERAVRRLIEALAADPDLPEESAASLTRLVDAATQRLDGTTAPLVRALRARDEAGRAFAQAPFDAKLAVARLAAEKEWLAALARRRRVVIEVGQTARSLVPLQAKRASRLVADFLTLQESIGRAEQWEQEQIAIRIDEILNPVPLPFLAPPPPATEPPAADPSPVPTDAPTNAPSPTGSGEMLLPSSRPSP